MALATAVVIVSAWAESNLLGLSSDKVISQLVSALDNLLSVIAPLGMSVAVLEYVEVLADKLAAIRNIDKDD